MTLPFSQQVTADATCRLLQAGSGFAAHIAVGSVLTGQVWGAVGATAGLVAMEALGRASGCYNNPDDAPGFEPGPTVGSGCKKVAPGGLMDMYIYTEDNPDGFWNSACIEVVSFEPHPERDGQILTWRLKDGTLRDIWFSDWIEPVWRTVLRDDAVCEEPAPGPQYPDHQPGDPIAPPFEYTDPETGCEWQIQATDSYINSAGEPIFFWQATSNDPTNCGGPYQWWGNGQEPNVPTFPDPRGPDVDPIPPPIPPGPGQDIKEKLDDILERLEELEKCACPEKPELAKHWRSIRFESDEKTPRGNRRLSKLFRYRGVSPGVVDDVADHWKDFRWTTGPACVYHKGSPLGTPKVWAATADEGKRVIRHAGREAGIDPDQVGEWGVSGSDNPRYGVSLEVGLFCVDGCWSATARPGPSGYPEAAVVLPDS